MDTENETLSDFDKAAAQLTDVSDSCLIIQQNQSAWWSGKHLYVGPKYWESFLEWKRR